MLTLFDVMRPNAVALVDAFDFPDHILQSCLGRYDGQVYQALYDYAKMAPMNQTEVSNVDVWKLNTTDFLLRVPSELCFES